MENQNSAEELHTVLGIVDTNIKNIKKMSNNLIVEDKSDGRSRIWDNNGIRIEQEEEKSEKYRNYTNILN